jgi:hypothetical protein
MRVSRCIFSEISVSIFSAPHTPVFSHEKN